MQPIIFILSIFLKKRRSHIQPNQLSRNAERSRNVNPTRFIDLKKVPDASAA